jgi:hypothetical protein
MPPKKLIKRPKKSFKSKNNTFWWTTFTYLRAQIILPLFVMVQLYTMCDLLPALLCDYIFVDSKKDQISNYVEKCIFPKLNPNSSMIQRSLFARETCKHNLV